MLLSDRDLKAAIAEGRLGLTPFDESLVQPSSIDVRLDRYFRVFANHRYTHIDPAEQQDDLTELVEPDGDEPFILHPGEFVLGSTLEVISLGDDLASRLEGKALSLSTEVPTPSGRVRVKVPPGSANGQRMRLGGRGVQHTTAPGDLYLVLRPVLPKAGADEAVELARQLDALTETDPRATLVI